MDLLSMDAKLGVTVFNSISKGVDALHRQLPFLFSLNINAQIQETAFFSFLLHNISKRKLPLL